MSCSADVGKHFETHVKDKAKLMNDCDCGYVLRFENRAQINIWNEHDDSNDKVRERAETDANPDGSLTVLYHVKSAKCVEAGYSHRHAS